ncbi:MULTISPECIES: ribose-phosphate diphosphokinase [Rhizobium]|uniref:ribose-phosphate diphosphokinase n=16 Tax=Rhizobium TaxID=379 RepID=Q8KKS6_RHIEC|nr:MULTISPECIES: ribose-phosphate diphosphokinase [Rhizobium]ACE94079.1 ribose-phosphate pyrophosphokinase protein [Rhizobium etli CIAT 652]AAM48300.1 ribose-phosphate pyrophosphokinase protein [Rhizobium etli CFN 42]ANK94412.1 ribose-phosphate pyrophosphokinase protein [Rhizobium sp. N6212]ANL00462.1 ribose-phosphate pyrophosphokinase protein [Rhizobium sp. N621]ANL06583.1 ribose-phosphate pyrophosphokinase protein [Rhizobium esperanzae]
MAPESPYRTDPAANDLRIAATETSAKFASTVHRALTRSGITILNTQVFSNGQMAVTPRDGGLGGNVVVVQTFPDSVHDRLFELFLALGAVRARGPRTITAVLPYLPYSRSDRPAFDGGPVPVRILAGIIETLGIDRLITFELHVPQLCAAFACPVVNLQFAPALVRHLGSAAVDGDMVVSPDFGGAKRAEHLAALLGCPFAVMRKHRRDDDDFRESVEILGDVAGRTIILIDDEINSGQTAFSAAAHLKAAGARKITLAAAHAIFTPSLNENWGRSQIDRIVVTDSVGRTDNFPDSVEVVSIGNEIAGALQAR